MSFENRVSLSITDQVANVRLNRPEKHNALDLEMFRAIVAVQRRLAREKDLRAVILGSAGMDFCTGLDVKSVMQDRSGARKLLGKWRPWRPNLAQAVSVGWRELPVPVFAAIHGRCWGGGLQIALGADFRIVAPDASLSVLEAKWGLIPDMGGTLALREIAARDHGMWLAMSAEVIDGEQALACGLATEISAQPEERAMAMAEALKQRSPDAVAAIKRLYRKSWAPGSGRALARETAYQLRIIAGKNQRIATARELGKDKTYRPAGRW